MNGYAAAKKSTGKPDFTEVSFAVAKVVSLRGRMRPWQSFHCRLITGNSVAKGYFVSFMKNFPLQNRKGQIATTGLQTGLAMTHQEVQCKSKISASSGLSHAHK